MPGAISGCRFSALASPRRVYSLPAFIKIESEDIIGLASLLRWGTFVDRAAVANTVELRERYRALASSDGGRELLVEVAVEVSELKTALGNHQRLHGGYGVQGPKGLILYSSFVVGTAAAIGKVMALFHM